LYCVVDRCGISHVGENGVQPVAMRLPQEFNIAFHARPAEIVEDDDVFAICQQLIHEVGPDKAGAPEYDDWLNRTGNCELHHG
jgi:hypothetical protein